jgi:hypothetical protein
MSLLVVIWVAGVIGWNCFEAVTSILLCQIVGKYAEYTLVLTVTYSTFFFSGHIAGDYCALNEGEIVLNKAFLNEPGGSMHFNVLAHKIAHFNNWRVDSLL